MVQISKKSPATAPRDPVDITLDEMLVTLRVRVQAVAICEVGGGWRMRMDSMDNPVIHYVLRGHGELQVGDNLVELQPHSFVVVPAGEEQTLAATGPVQAEKRGLDGCVAVGDGMLRMRAGNGNDFVTTCGAVSAMYGQTLGFFDHLDVPLMVNPRYAETIRHSFANIIDELAHPTIGTQAITSALMKQCIVLIVRSEFDDEKRPGRWLWTLRDARLAPVITAILDRPADRHTVDSLARIAAMSRSAFSKRFTRTFGVSPIDFVTLVRLNQAAHLLARTKLPIKVIASSVGYESRSYFSRAFRANFNASPTTFRKFHGNAPGAQSWQPLRALKEYLADDD